MRFVKLSFCLGLISFLTACGHNDSPPAASPYDPTALVDVSEREVWTDCSGKVTADKMVRRAAVNMIKVNPKRNIPIDSSSFFNVDMENAEFTPRLDFIKGPGGDNYKFVKFCQGPRADGCDMVVKNGDNRIEYKFWSYRNAPCKGNPSHNCQTDFLEENDIQTIHFTASTVLSNRVCKRTPSVCPMAATVTWSNCTY